MKYHISYACTSHVGHCRSMNQDNFICDGKYMDPEKEPITFPLIGSLTPGVSPVIGIFDGMGGEACGEIASLLAASEAAKMAGTESPEKDLKALCQRINEKIYRYADENDTGSMGTTAALLSFADHKIALCNIGDSKIFRFSDQRLEQLSVDHVAIGVFGRKPPLSQNLGIPPSEMLIDPYIAVGKYHHNDVYLICSDGLTDMMSLDEISEILEKNTIDAALEALLDQALSNGGKDNITMILCKIERQSLLKRIFNLKENRKEDYNHVG